MDLSSKLPLRLEKEKRIHTEDLCTAKKKKLIKKHPMKHVQIGEQSLKHQEESRGHGSSQIQNIPTRALTKSPRSNKAFSQFGEWFPTQYTSIIDRRCKANQIRHIRRNQT